MPPSCWGLVCRGDQTAAVLFTQVGQSAQIELALINHSSQLETVQLSLYCHDNTSSTMAAADARTAAEASTPRVSDGAGPGVNVASTTGVASQNMDPGVLITGGCGKVQLAAQPGSTAVHRFMIMALQPGLHQLSAVDIKSAGVQDHGRSLYVTMDKLHVMCL